jgi:hypothetical protein
MSASEGFIYYKRRGQVVRGQTSKCSEVDESRDFFCLQKGRCGMVDVAVVLANPVGAV